MSAPRFSDEMRRECSAAWDAVLAHPFVAGLGDGTLPPSAFRRYMVQDYLFLVEYARVLALATAKAADPGDMGRLAELLNATLNTEMSLHREFAGYVGIPSAEMDGAAMTPACHAYTSHLLAVAWGEPLGVLAASLLPCQLGYAEIGTTLARGGEPDVPEFAQWVQMYASEEYVGLARWLAGRADALAEQAGPNERGRMAAVYRESLRLEHGFWDMALGAEVDGGL